MLPRLLLFTLELLWVFFRSINVLLFLVQLVLTFWETNFFSLSDGFW